MAGVGLLERAIGYARTSLSFVTYESLANGTPCRSWDLRALLQHMEDSLAALQEAADVAYVGLDSSGGDTSADLVASLRGRACALLGSWAANDGALPVSVAGRPLPAGVLASTGALEIAVHGWDVARACGAHHPLPASLAAELLRLAPMFVGEQDRPGRFAPPIELAGATAPDDRLLAVLGRLP